MNFIFKTITIVAGICLLVSCSNKSPRERAEQAPNETSAAYEQEVAPQPERIEEAASEKPTNFVGSSAASTVNDDDVHQFIRTADMKFRVKNVPEATYTIEDIVLKNRGFILRSAINNENTYSEEKPVSKDSSLVIYHSNLVADLQLRVPRTQLDTVLKEIAPLALEISYRHVEANDVTLQLLSEKLKQNRLTSKEKRLSDAIDSKGKKLDDIVEADAVLDQTQESADRSKLAQYSLKDQIEYSAISIKLYQSTSRYQEMIAREKEVETYTPGLGDQALEALQNGWQIISWLFIMILNLWSVLLIALIGWMLYRRYKKKREDE